MPTTITQLTLDSEREIEKSNAKLRMKTRISRGTIADARKQLVDEYAKLFDHYGRYSGYSRKAELKSIDAQHDYDAPSPKWIKTQNLVRNRTKRINGKVFQRSTRWCDSLEQRADRLDKFDTIRLFQHGAKKGR